MIFALKQEIERRLSLCASEGEPGKTISLPRIAKPLTFHPSAEWDRRAELARFGVELTGEPGQRNYIVLDADAPPSSSKTVIQLFGGSDQLIVLDGEHRLIANVRLEGQNQTLVISKRISRPFHSNSLILRGNNTSVIIGRETTSNGSTILVDGHNTCILIGDDCMISHGVEIIASDSHCIFDIESLANLSTAANVFIGRHVWIGAHVSINKGVRIGDGSIVGTRSVVTKDIPPASLYVGSPARELKAGVTWARERYASAEVKRLVLKNLGFQSSDMRRVSNG
jgi:acetyltransferase-like isoleucine patch superfamily enzyme